VTPKEGVDEGGLRVLRMLGLCTGVGVLLVAVWSLRLLDVVGVVDLPAMPELATAVVLALGVWEIACITKTLVPLVRRHQVRLSFRKEVALPARLAGTADAVEIVDMTPDGLAFTTPVGCPRGTRLRLETSLADPRGVRHPVILPVEVRAVRQIDRQGTRRVSCRMLEVDRELHERLVEYCDVVVPAARFSRSHGLAPEVLDADRRVA
jgi:hypothetical protein